MPLCGGSPLFFFFFLTPYSLIWYQDRNPDLLFLDLSQFFFYYWFDFFFGHIHMYVFFFFFFFLLFLLFLLQYGEWCRTYQKEKKSDRGTMWCRLSRRYRECLLTRRIAAEIFLPLIYFVLFLCFCFFLIYLHPVFLFLETKYFFKYTLLCYLDETLTPVFGFSQFFLIGLIFFYLYPFFGRYFLKQTHKSLHLMILHIESIFMVTLVVKVKLGRFNAMGPSIIRQKLACLLKLL